MIGPVRTPLESVGPNPSYPGTSVVAISVATYVLKKSWINDEQYRSRGPSVVESFAEVVALIVVLAA